MPLYEYWCHACGYIEERILTLEEGKEKLFSCPKCGARLTKKIGNISHFEFKGNLKRI